MSLFQTVLVKIEKFTDKEQDGSLPLVSVSRKYEVIFYAVMGLIACIYLYFSWSIWSTFYEDMALPTPQHWWYTKQAKSPEDARAYYEKEVYAARSIKFMMLHLMTAAMIMCSSYVIFHKAIDDRRELRKRKAELKQQTDHQKAIAKVETDRQQAALFAVRAQRQQQIEDGIREVLREGRKRMEWIPETADEERIYELIRQRIKASRAPEFGLLRRTTDMRVLIILGNDLSYLPPEPSDEVLARRLLPPVVQLLR